MDSLLSPKNDVVFKMLFGTEENKDLLKALIADMAKIDCDKISDLQLQNVEIAPENVRQKFCRLDVLVTVDNVTIDIEIQLEGEDYFGDRLLYYWGLLYTRALKRGHNYSKLRRTITIAFVDFNMFKHRDIHSEFGINDLKHKTTLSKKCEMHIFELKKARFSKDESDPEKAWVQFLKAEKEEDLTMLESMGNAGVNNAAVVLRRISADPKARALAQMRRDTKREEVSALYYAEKRGIAKGEAKGIEIGKAEGIVVGKAEGIAIGEAKGIDEAVQVFKNLGLSDDMIKKALRNLKKKK